MSDTDSSGPTPGPWHYGEDQRGINRVFAGDCEIVRALSTHGTRRLSRSEREANAKLIARAPAMAAELDRQRALVAQMRKALEGKDHKWADKLWEFLLAEYEAIPTSGETVTADVRPHFDALCEFMAARDAALQAAEEIDNG